MRPLQLLFNLVLSASTITTPAVAASLQSPEGKVVLSVSGKIGNTNADNAAVFDLSMLEALGLETVETTTPWYDGIVKFEGVRLDKLMKYVAANGVTAVAVALNDYVTKIPIEDFSKYNVILAIKRDGDYMPIRDKGPLFIIYPFDSDPNLQSQTYYGRSAWQLSKLIIE